MQCMGRYKRCYVGPEVCSVCVDTSNVMWGLTCAVYALYYLDGIVCVQKVHSIIDQKSVTLVLT